MSTLKNDASNLAQKLRFPDKIGLLAVFEAVDKAIDSAAGGRACIEPVADLEEGAKAAAVAAKLNELIAALRAAGLMAEEA